MVQSAQFYNQLNEYVDISGHIDFAEALINKYEWDAQTKDRLSSQLMLIRNKQKDKCLNLSVIGEFSTGKSTFINALLGEKLLVSSVIQGTTVVNTIIEYYSQPILYILRKDGTYDVVTSKNLEELSVRLSDVTTNPKTARDIKLVRVGMPSQLLANGLRIIDTPGTNSTESWHEDVTKDALRNLSDLSIILTDAIHPLPQTLIDFVNENLSEIYNQCAFIVTYYDKLRKRERQDTLQYISKKLTLEFEINNPRVLPYIAPAVLATLSGESIMPNQDEMVKISSESYSQLLEIMWRNRQISQIKKLLSLTKDAFGILEQSIESQKKKYAREYQILLKTKQTSLDPFVEAEKQLRINDFGNKATDIKDDLNTAICSRISTAKSRVKNFIMNSSALNAEDIKKFIETEVPKECNRQASYVAQLMDETGNTLLRAFSDAMAAYHRSFERQFNRLGILQVNMGSITLDKPKIHAVSLSNLKASLDYMSNEVSKENWAMGSGGVAGAAIGTAICPGIGTVVGGLLGVFASAMITPSAEDMKKNACDKLTGPLDSVFQTVERDIIATFNDNIITYKSAIKREIDRYLEKYKTTVDRRIAEHNSLIEKNQREASKISVDLKLITLRRAQLKSISETLN